MLGKAPDGSDAGQIPRAYIHDCIPTAMVALRLGAWRSRQVKPLLPRMPPETACVEAFTEIPPRHYRGRGFFMFFRATIANFTKKRQKFARAPF